MPCEIGEETFLVCDMMRHFDPEDQVEGGWKVFGKRLGAILMADLCAVLHMLATDAGAGDLSLARRNREADGAQFRMPLREQNYVGANAAAEIESGRDLGEVDVAEQDAAQLPLSGEQQVRMRLV